MIVEAMTAHADERARRHGSWSPQIRAAAETLNQVRLEFVAAALDFEREDTPDTRRAVAECEWRFIAARHAYYEARARSFLL
jgi:hypothetical protein